MSIKYEDLSSAQGIEMPLNVVIVATTESIHHVRDLRDTGLFGGNAVEIISSIGSTLVSTLCI